MVKILDSTLREGEQTPGVYFPLHVKLEIAEYLDRVGVDIIEAGHPMVSGNIKNSVKQISNKGLNAIIGAHSRSLIGDIKSAIECDVDFIGVFHCVSDGRLNDVFKKDLDSVISQITETISYAKSYNPNLIVRYTPENTVLSEYENVIRASVAAVKAGADIISVADTTGYMIPRFKGRNMLDFVKNLKNDLDEYGLNQEIEVHCHDDRGLALANAIEGYMAGADIIDTTVLKLGERVGLVDLATLLVILNSDFDEKNNWNLKELPNLYKIVSKYSKIEIPVNFPVTGKNAFTHCAGVHTNAAIIDPVHYQSLDPSLVGREMEISLDHMSGISSIRYALKQIGVNISDNGFVLDVLRHVKNVGETGRRVDLPELEQIVKLVSHDTK